MSDEFSKMWTPLKVKVKKFSPFHGNIVPKAPIPAVSAPVVCPLKPSETLHFLVLEKGLKIHIVLCFSVQITGQNDKNCNRVSVMSRGGGGGGLSW